MMTSSVDSYQQREYAINRWRQRAEKYDMRTQACQERYGNECRMRRESDRNETAQLMQRINESVRSKKGSKFKQEAIRLKPNLDSNETNENTYNMTSSKVALKRKIQTANGTELPNTTNNGFLDDQQQQHKKQKTDIEEASRNIDPSKMTAGVSSMKVKQEQQASERTQDANDALTNLLGDDDLFDNEYDWKNFIDIIVDMDGLDKPPSALTPQSMPVQTYTGPVPTPVTAPQQQQQAMHCKQEKVDMMQHGFHGNNMDKNNLQHQPPVPRPNMAAIMNQQSVSTPNFPSHASMTHHSAMNVPNHQNYNMTSAIHRNSISSHPQQSNVLSRQTSAPRTHQHPSEMLQNHPTTNSHMTSQHIQRLNNVSVNSQFSPPSGASEPPRLFHPPANQNNNGSTFYQSSQQLKHLAEKQWSLTSSNNQMTASMPTEMSNQFNRVQYRGPTPLQTQRLSHMDQSNYSHPQIMMNHRSSSSDMMMRQSAAMTTQMQHPGMMTQRSSSLNHSQSYSPAQMMSNNGFSNHRTVTHHRVMPGSNFVQSSGQPPTQAQPAQQRQWTSQQQPQPQQSTWNGAGQHMQPQQTSMQPQMSAMTNGGYPQNFPQLDIDAANNDDLRLLDEIISK